MLKIAVRKFLFFQFIIPFLYFCILSSVVVPQGFVHGEKVTRDEVPVPPDFPPCITKTRSTDLELPSTR